jgi:DNA-binding transcriptional regulator LsrR (DeoR family)
LTSAAPTATLVLAAGGAQKVPIITAAIRAGLCHVLITDEDTASAVLSHRQLRAAKP